MSNIIDKIRLSGTDYTLSATTSGVSVVEVTQAEYDALPSSAKTDASKMYVITDAQGGDLSNYWTTAETMSAITEATSGKANSSDVYLKSETSGATQISDALSGKQDTLSAGTGIDITDNVISATGGGSTYTAGRGIDITNNTISSTLPISAGTGTNSAIIGYYNSGDSYWDSKATGEGAVACGVRCSATTHHSFAVGYNNTAAGRVSSEGNFAQGYMTKANGNRCHSEGLNTTSSADASHSEGSNTIASGNYSHSEGENVNATNTAEHSQGRYNVSNKANTTWGDSGNTLFSVGNGTADNARHNAFEIRQNGDIYISSGGTDILLQDYLGGGGSSINVVQTTGSSTTDVMSQAAVTNIIGDIETLLSNI